MTGFSTRGTGYIVTFLGVLLISPDGLLTRFISADALTITFWRGLLFGLTTSAFILMRYRAEIFGVLARFRWPEYGIMVAYCIGNILFIYSITHTSVANTLFMISTTPIWAALIAWAFLKERVARRTWFSIFMVIVGILVITSGADFASGQWLGDLAGLGGAGALAAQFSLIRQARQRDTLPAMALGGIFTALVVSPFVVPEATSNLDLAYLVIMGVLMLPIANALLFLGPKFLPAPEVGLVMLMETILGPFWVWLVIDENPGLHSIIGGTIVLLTLAINTFLSLREEVKITNPP